MKQVKTIGVLTSGGDAPGMNAAIRAVVRAGIGKGMRVLGIRRGYNGLINGDMVEMNLRSVSDILQKGGTILYTARCLEFKEESGIERAKQTCVETGLDGVVVIGGDGSFRGARDLSLRGIPCVGIPGTIDNDISSSDYTIGYDTAMNTVVQNVDRLRDTSQSHDRCSVVEVMGRNAGHIAVNTGLACGAIAILIPEIPFDVDRDIVAKIKASQKPENSISLLWWLKELAILTSWRRKSKRKPALSPAPQYWGTFSAAVPRPCVTVWLPVRWGIMRWNCWKKGLATAL